MGLKIKSMYDVLSDLIEWITSRTNKITDFNVGSAIRTLCESIAIQFEEFYFSMKQNVLYAIENSVYDSFGFNLKIAEAASGYVTVAFEEPLPSSLTFPKGTVFCTAAIYGYIYFESTEEHYAEQGLVSTMIPVVCKTPGTIGNVPAGAITTIVTTNAIIKSVSNESAFTNGLNEETTTERKKRFQNYIKTLARGTVDAIIYGCLEVEGVTGAWCDDKYIGYVKLYAHNAEGELPNELKQAIINNLQNYRAGGIEVEVLPIVKRPIDLSLKILIGNDYDTETYSLLIQSSIISWLNEYSVAKNLYMSDVIHTIKTVYEDIVVNILIENGSDVQLAENELVRPGEISIRCVNVKDWRL